MVQDEILLINILLESISSGITSFFGEVDYLLEALLMLMIVDFITGVMKSILGRSEKSKNGYIRSVTMWNCGAKKILTLLIIALASILNSLMIPETALMRVMAITYYISVEALSIIENVSQCGLPIPQKIINILESLKEK